MLEKHHWAITKYNLQSGSCEMNRKDNQGQKKIHKRKTQMRSSQGQYSCQQDEPHGLDVSPDIPTGDLHDLMMSCYSANEVIEFTATKTTIDTIGQGDDTRKRLWHEERRKHLTASSVGKIAKR